jgi:aspartate kinase
MMAARIISSALDDGYEVTSVVSTGEEEVQKCLSLSCQLTANPNVREIETLLQSRGQITSTLLALAIESLGVSSRSLPAGAIADMHTLRNSETINVQPVEDCLARGEVAVIAGGAIVRDSKSNPCLVSDCSDLLAAAIGSALEAEQCEYFISGPVLSTVPEAYTSERSQSIESLDYEQAEEWIRSGMQFVSNDALEFAVDTQLPLRIKSLREPESPGTFISHRLAVQGERSYGIIVDDNFAILNMTSETFENDSVKDLDLSSVFLRFAEVGAQADMLFLLSREDQNIHELSFAVKDTSLNQVLRILEANKEKIGLPNLHVEQGFSRVSVIGRMCQIQPGLVSKIFDALSKAHLSIKLVATSDLRISLLVQQEFASSAVRLIDQLVATTVTPDQFELG